jgi:16S rRNA (uracil1498-N3)-methyltransferase
VADPRVYVDLDLHEGAIVELPDAVHRHLVVVLRRIRGDTVTLFNGRGGEYTAALETLAKKTATARVSRFHDVTRESKLHVTLGQAVSKGDRMDYSLQKAIELGVAEVQPLVTERVVVNLSQERWERKREHWQGIVTAACEQSGRTRVPQVAPVLDLRDWLNHTPPDAMKLVLSPEGAPARLKHQGQPIVLLVGPEGGLTDQELRLSDLAGFAALPLGPRTLRTETAGVTALSVLQARWGDLGSALGA